VEVKCDVEENERHLKSSVKR